VRNGWQTRPLGELCDLRGGSTPPKGNSAYWAGGDIPWFTINDIREQGRSILSTTKTITQAALEDTSVKLLPAGSVLLCCTASVGEYAIARIPLTTNQQFVGLVVRDRARLSPDFLFHFAATLKDELLGLSGKTTIDFVPLSRLRDVAVPLPPLADQQRIVGILDEAFTAIATARANAERNLRNARELFESQLDAVFARRGPGWARKPLGDAFVTVTGATPPKNNAGYYGNFIPLVKPPELRDAVFDSAGDGLSELGATVARVVPPRSVLVSCIGNLGKVGLNAVPVAFNQQINAIVADETHAVPEFMFMQALSSPFRDQLETLATGTTISLVNKSKFNSVTVVLPPLPEQKVIAGQLLSLRERTQYLESVYQRKLALLDALKQSLLHQAFMGAL
jgi:type I restriction enzyme S subunit